MTEKEIGIILISICAAYILINLLYVVMVLGKSSLEKYLPLDSIWDFWNIYLPEYKMNLFGKITCSIIVCLFCPIGIGILSLAKFIKWAFYYHK